jgi:hypothetical protein
VQIYYRCLSVIREDLVHVVEFNIVDLTRVLLEPEVTVQIETKI